MKSVSPMILCPPSLLPSIDLFGMPLHVVRMDEAVEYLVALARGDRAAYAVTSNVDHLLRFARNPSIRNLYTEADLNVADGMPLVWASRILGTPLPERVAGSDLFPRLCERAGAEGLSVFFFGGEPGAAEGSAQVLMERFPALRVAGTYFPDYGFEKDPRQSAAAVEAVRSVRPDILFVGLGSPKQEKWIVENREVAGAKLSIGIGVSFSFVSGQVKRAPKWMQRCGLEWAHRLTQEPGRLWKRYLLQDTPFLCRILLEAARRRWRSDFPGARRERER